MLGGSPIRTPDQRLRVFVSSTIQELAPERGIVRTTISNLRLIPVLFEMGARPHPPRDLYRAYLDQSDIFVGIYWQSYGWVAPTSDISGLEDEFQLSEGKPRLIYVKEPAPDRQSRLSDLLELVRNSESVSYQRFRSPEELVDLIANDLAVLLSERFSTPSATSKAKPALAARSLPKLADRLIGRDNELRELEEVLLQPQPRLITLTGPGGTGKSRLGLELAHRVAAHFEDGVRFVSLGEVGEPAEVVGRIGRDLGLQDSGRQPIAETVTEYLGDKGMLILIDNFEQVLSASPLLSRLLEAATRVKILVTSRAPLRLTGEYEYHVSPLTHPVGDPSELGVELEFPAVELFVERAKEANPALVLDSAQIEAIAGISRSLDGLPLAIELAAARTRYLDPKTLATHMTSTLDLLSKGPRDLPARQQTMRAAIGWSEGLLEDRAHRLFRRMAVLNGESLIDSIEAIANWEGDLGTDLFEELESLVDLGLVRVSSAPTGEPRFSMLRTVQEYASEKLMAAGEMEAAGQRHAHHFLTLAEEAEPYLWLSDRGPWIDRLFAEADNLRQAFDTLHASNDQVSLWRLAAALGPYLMVRGPQGQSVRLLGAVGINAETPLPDGVSQNTAAAVMRGAGILYALIGDFQAAIPHLRRATDLFSDAGDSLGAARAKTFLGVSGISTGDPSAMPDLAGGLQLGLELGDTFASAVASTFMAEVSLAFGDFDGARKYVADAEAISRSQGDRWLLGITLLQKGNVAIVSDDMEAAIPTTEECYSVLHEGQSSVAGWPMVGLGYCHLRLKNVDLAAKYFDQSIEHGRVAGDKTIVLSGLMGLAGVAVNQGEIERAAMLLGASDAIRASIGYQLWSATLVMNNLVEALIGAAGHETQVAEGRERGGRLSYEDAVALATK